MADPIANSSLGYTNRVILNTAGLDLLDSLLGSSVSYRLGGGTRAHPKESD